MEASDALFLVGNRFQEAVETGFEVFVDQMIVDNTNEIDDRIDILVAEVRALRAEILEKRTGRES